MKDLLKLKNRIDNIVLNKINAFSPTISPAPKSEERQEIESIYEAFKYYVEKGVNDFIVQMKYMGSYCDIYLHKDIQQTYFVSRNAFLIRSIELQKLIDACKTIHEKIDWAENEIAILQAELLPWHALGENLIQNEFGAYLHSHKIHHQYLKDKVLYDKIELVRKSEAFQKYLSDKETLSENKFKENYPSHLQRQYEGMRNFRILDIEKYAQGINLYEEQLNHFGKDEVLYFKPFNILKYIKSDGEETIPNDNYTFKLVNEDKHLVLKIDHVDDLDNVSKSVYDWFSELKNNNVEGIMIKPQKSFINGIPPAFKVRNDSYLTMIYGINFMEEYSKNIRKRSIDQKLRASIQDWMLNWNLLKVNYNKINTENYFFKNLLYDRIMEESFEQKLDQRL